MGTTATLNPLAGVGAPRNAADMAFLGQLDRSGEHWYGPGEVTIAGVPVPLERAVFAVHHGYARKNMIVAPECGEEGCVHPEHLRYYDRPLVPRAKRGENRPKGSVPPSERNRPTSMAGIKTKLPMRENFFYGKAGSGLTKAEKAARLHEVTLEQYELYKQGFSTTEVAAMYGMSQGSLSQRFIRQGLPTRSTGEGVVMRNKRMKEGTYSVEFDKPRDA